MNHFFGQGNLGQLFKQPTKVLDYRNKVIKSFTYRSGDASRADAAAASHDA